ncbi:MAG TPA: hypothetical protein VER36_03035 [Flavisolibacter sp.]|nr:hypothetical protein [Flavisolibacter sp.]
MYLLAPACTIKLLLTTCLCLIVLAGTAQDTTKYMARDGSAHPAALREALCSIALQNVQECDAREA